MLLALGGDGRNGNREESAEKTERVGRETESAVKILEELLIFGYRKNASDIHMEPWEDRFVIRMRIDGMMTMVREFDKSMYQPLVTRAKVISGMDIAKKRVPQDGHFRETIKGIRLDMRTSVIPTIFGEKMVLRFLDRKTEIDHCGTFGMNEENYKKMIQILRSPGGILYLTGPTGCGKTTTLYLILEYLLRQPVNIVTIEDPVERYLPGISQIQVNEQAGLTFESGLRAVLRQDPDIIMIGEIRDQETAQIAVQASITGHLVVSTLHTNSSASTISRLEDMGVESYLLADSVKGIIAQRLVRRLCPACKREHLLTEEEKAFMNIPAFRPVKIYEPCGCEKCANTGYKGRIGIYEIMTITPKLKSLISKGVDIEDINKAACDEGMHTLRQSAEKLVLEGVTSFQEMLKTTFEN